MSVNCDNMIGLNDTNQYFCDVIHSYWMTLWKCGITFILPVPCQKMFSFSFKVNLFQASILIYMFVILHRFCASLQAEDEARPL